MLWARDDDVPARTVKLASELLQNGARISFLCGTKQCHEVMSARDVNVHMLRVPSLWRESDDLARLASQEQLAVMRLRFAGVAFENAVEALTALAALVRPPPDSMTLRVYLHPLVTLPHGVGPLLRWANARDSSPIRVLLSKSTDGPDVFGAIRANMTLPSWRATINVGMAALASQISTPLGEEIRSPPLRPGWDSHVLCRAIKSACEAGTAILGTLQGVERRRTFHLIDYASQGCRGEVHLGDHFRRLSFSNPGGRTHQRQPADHASGPSWCRNARGAALCPAG